MNKELKVKILADWKDQKSIDINDIFKEIAKELEYINTFKELKKAAEDAMVPLAEAIKELAKAMNEQLLSSDEAAAALTNFYKSLEENHVSEIYSPAEGIPSSYAIGFLKEPNETYTTVFKPGHEPIEITFEEKEKDLLEETNLNDWYDSFLNSL